MPGEIEQPKEIAPLTQDALVYIVEHLGREMYEGGRFLAAAYLQQAASALRAKPAQAKDAGDYVSIDNATLDEWFTIAQRPCACGAWHKPGDGTFPVAPPSETKPKRYLFSYCEGGQHQNCSVRGRTAECSCDCHQPAPAPAAAEAQDDAALVAEWHKTTTGIITPSAVCDAGDALAARLEAQGRELAEAHTWRGLAGCSSFEEMHATVGMLAETQAHRDQLLALGDALADVAWSNNHKAFCPCDQCNAVRAWRTGRAGMEKP